MTVATRKELHRGRGSVEFSHSLLRAAGRYARHDLDAGRQIALMERIAADFRRHDFVGGIAFIPMQHLRPGGGTAGRAVFAAADETPFAEAPAAHVIGAAAALTLSAVPGRRVPA